MAGDRGLHHPELTASALDELRDELDGLERERGAIELFVSSNRTCEIALAQVTGRPFESAVVALERLTRP
jgi:D-lactate dehydrogenase